MDYLNDLKFAKKRVQELDDYINQVRKKKFFEDARHEYVPESAIVLKQFWKERWITLSVLSEDKEKFLLDAAKSLLELCESSIHARSGTIIFDADQVKYFVAKRNIETYEKTLTNQLTNGNN